MFFSYMVFILSISTLCRCENLVFDNKVRTAFVEGIIRKVSNLTLDSLANASPDKKQDILKDIEAKLQKSASSLGQNGRKYVKLIMRGVKMMSSNDSTTTTTVKSKAIQAKRTLGENKQDIIIKTQMKTPKKKLIDDIARKIEKLAKVYFKSTNTSEERLKIMENIKNKMLKSVNVKHTNLHHKHDELKSYIDIITRGVERVLQRIRDDQARRMDIEFSNNIIEVKRNNDNEMNQMTLDINEGNHIMNDSCKRIFNETCYSAKSLNKLECLYDHYQIPIEKLCDGVIDCSDESDENDCQHKVTEKVRMAEDLIWNLNISIINDCFHSIIDSNLLAQQTEVLGSFLDIEIKFLNKYVNDTTITNGPYKMVSVQDVADILTTLAYTIDKSLCDHLSPKEIDLELRKALDPDDADLEKIESVWSPNLCKCKGQYCHSEPCHISCKRVCWQKYSLDRWLCEAVNGGDTVPIDLVCDGKLDCLDDSDESGCAQGASYAKFEANDIYDNILKMIETKISLNDNLEIRTGLQKLNQAVKQLQKNSIKKNADARVVKDIRNKCFSILKSVFSRARFSNTIFDELEEMYAFLHSLNVNLIAALKKTHLGNDMIVTQDGCFCRGGKCALPACTKSCIRRCSAEPLLTRYFCEGPSNNNSIPLDALCNEKINCPNGDDEENCKLKEICRKHHFVILRHNLEGVGVKEKGTAIGEVLTAWKNKVLGTLSIAENNERPSPKILRDIIYNMLQDLVKTYASINDFRRSDSNILKEFTKLSQVIIDTIKECGK